MGITIDFERDNLLTDFAKETLRDRYLLPHEGSPQNAFARAAAAFSDTEEMAQKMYDYASKLWVTFSTPITTNASTESFVDWMERKARGEEGNKKRGLPISCYLNHVPDSRVGLTDHYTENAFLSSLGGGIGGYWGAVRSDGEQTSGGSASSGSIPFMKIVDAEMLAFSQGKTRRGSYASYQDISHPEIEEFIEMRKPSGGDQNRKCLNLHHGVNISDKFMNVIEKAMKIPDFDDSWDLIDPNSGKIVKTVSATGLWQKIIETRMSTGEPYIHFIDTTRKKAPEWYKAAGLADKIRHSNLCSEITLAVDDDYTAVCCLSSLNIEKFDEWSNDREFIYWVVRYLDNVIEYFVQEAPEDLWRAKASAANERSIGIGALGLHAYYQSKNTPFGSAVAKSMNNRIFKTIKKQALEASRKLAEERGEAPCCVGYGVRNAHLMAVAPNASTSIIAGTSPSIEPSRANAYLQKTMSGSFLVKNKYLEELLESKDRNTEKVWSDIITNGGSVQHLDWLDDYEKEVFKTAIELDQRWIVDFAGDRADSICQSQSVNLFFPATANIPYLHAVHFLAWKRGVKSLYYLRSESLRTADNVSKKIELKDILDGSTCLACEG